MNRVNLGVQDKGVQMHALAARLFPICRSLTGDGVRESFAILKAYLPQLAVHEVPSGTKCFDWTIPDEWAIRDAYVIDLSSGERVIDFCKHNLHVVGYSEPIHREMSLDELQPHLHSLPDRPTAIPSITSYYKRTWGFCLSHHDREHLNNQSRFKVVIDSTLSPGKLTYGELYIPGRSSKEIFFSTYICHPSMANDNLSGPVLGTYLAQWATERDRAYSYRFVFIPETIGAVCYLSRNLDHLRRDVIAGFNVSCAGDERCYSYIASPRGKTLADRVMQHVLSHTDINFCSYSYLDRGSDERQYCMPGVDLPVIGFTRSKYGHFPEYHTSLDDLSFVTAKGLGESLHALSRCCEAIENNRNYISTQLGEPQLGKRNLYPSTSNPAADAFWSDVTALRLNLLAYSDGKTPLLDIASILGVPIWVLYPQVEKLIEHDLLKEISSG
jgi:aminopeptidase-like protein